MKSKRTRNGLFVAAALLILAAVIASLFRELATVRTRDRAHQELTFEMSPPSTKPEGLAGQAGNRVRASTWKHARIRGTVHDEHGDPIAGAIVGLLENKVASADRAHLREHGQLTRTGSDGRFVLSPSSELDTKSSSLHARAKGYLAASLPMSKSNHASGIEIVLRDGLEIRGRLIGPPGDEKPLPHVKVVARGSRAGSKAGGTEVFWGAQACLQRTMTDERGEFVISGLAQGAYVLEVVAAGLVPFQRMVDMKPSAAGAPRGVIVDAGASEVVLQAYPVAIASCVVVDDTTGLPLASSLCGPRINALRLIGHTSSAPRVLVANGRTWDLRRQFASQAVHTHIVMHPKWPIPDSDTLRCNISAEGYTSVTTEIPLVALGKKPIQPVTVKLRSKLPMTSIRFELRDDLNQPIGPCRVWLYLNPLRGGSSTFKASVSLNSQGMSNPVAVPRGTYRAGSDPRDPMFSLKPTTFAAESSNGVPVRLELASCAIRVECEDSDGHPLGDVGFLVAPGTGEIRPHWIRFKKQGVITQRGVFSLGPGAGESTSGPGFTGQGGPWTVEAYRPGHRPARVTTTLVRGRLVTVHAVLEDANGAPWDTWNRHATNTPEDVMR